jgi:hypothetical protein
VPNSGRLKNGEVITSFKFKFRMPVGANSKEYEFFDEKGRS